MKKTVALLLTVLMLLPCCMTAASAADVPLTAFGNNLYRFVPCINLEPMVRPWKDSDFGVSAGWVKSKETSLLTGLYTVSCTYDQQGRLLKKVEDDSVVTVYTYSYDEAGLLIKESMRRTLKETVVSFRGTLSSVTAYAYDADGRLKKMVKKSVDETGAISKTVTAIAYDAAGRIKKVTMLYTSRTGASEKVVYTYAYDRTGNLSKIVAAGYGDDGSKVSKQTEYTWTHDANGTLRKLVLVTKTTAGMQTSTVKSAWSFDQNGNLIKAVDRERGITAAYVYDENGRMIKAKEQHSESIASEAVISFAYDRDGRVTKCVEIVISNEGARSTTTFVYAYDGGGNMKKVAMKTVRFNAENSSSSPYKGAIAFKYDKYGNLLKMVALLDDEAPFTMLSRTYQKAM